MAFKRLTPSRNCDRMVRVDKATTTESISQWSLVKIIHTTGTIAASMVDSNTDATVTNVIRPAENRSASGSAEPVLVCLSEDVEYEADLFSATSFDPFDPVALSPTTSKVPASYARVASTTSLAGTTTEMRVGYATEKGATASKIRMRFFPPSKLFTG